MPVRKPEKLDPLLVVNAYARGIFPMADHHGRIDWYAPDPRAILEHEHLRISRSLRATLRRARYEVRLDTAFSEVMRQCAARPETWINSEFINTYTHLYTVGLAHSVEAWQGERLVGGLYGLALGGAFMGESMFSHETDASKVCLVALVTHLQKQGYVLHDTQFLTPHLASMGVTEISRQAYEERLRHAIGLPCRWHNS